MSQRFCGQIKRNLKKVQYRAYLAFNMLKKTFYFGNISWFGCSTVKKIQSNGGNRFKHVSGLERPSWYIALVSSFLFPLGAFENTWWWALFIFKKITDMPLLNCKIHRKNFAKISLPIVFGQRKRLISRISKKPDSSFRKYIFLQKMNVGREKTISQWLISFRKNTAQ